MRTFLIIVLLPAYFFEQEMNSIKPTIEIFQANLLDLADAMEKKDALTIDQLMFHKPVTDEQFARELENALNEPLLPLEAINSMEKTGEFGPLLTIVSDEMHYQRHLTKTGVKADNCYAYFHEVNGIDIFVIAEWNESYFRFIRIKNLKALLPQ